MKATKTSENDQLRAQFELLRTPVRKAVAAKILELSEGGLDDHEIAKHLCVPAHLVRVVLRGGAPR
jgi:hypothetical protein